MTDTTRPPRAFEPWMISNVGVGAATASFLTLLVPPFVADVTGSATRVGLVFAVISLAAVVGPLIARLADRTGRHGLIYVLSLFALAASFALLAIDANMARWSPIFGLILGVAVSAQGTIGPTFIVGARLGHEVTSKQLTAFTLTSPIGQLIGSLIVSLAIALGLSTLATFWVAAGILALFAVLTIPFIAAPERRLKLATARPVTSAKLADAPPAAVPAATTRVIAGGFAIFLIAVLVSSAGSSGFGSQISNIMPKVYGFTSSGTALLIGLAGLLNIGVIVWAGWWLGRSTSLTVYTVGTVARGVGALLMAIIGLFTSPILVLAALAMLLTYQASPLTRLSGSDLAATLSSGSASVANGYFFAATALGSVVGSLSAGLLADRVNYNSVNLLASITSLAAAALIVSALLPLVRRASRQATG
jgi:predicted MFS family arabinose efflux permease